MSADVRPVRVTFRAPGVVLHAVWTTDASSLDAPGVTNGIIDETCWWMLDTYGTNPTDWADTAVVTEVQA